MNALTLPPYVPDVAERTVLIEMRCGNVCWDGGSLAGYPGDWMLRLLLQRSKTVVVDPMPDARYRKMGEGRFPDTDGGARLGS